MKTVQLQTWELYYSDLDATLRMLVNGSVVFFLTRENMMEFLEAVSDDSLPVVALAQKMIQQQVSFAVDANDDGTEEEYAVFNWRVSDYDLSPFAVGEKELIALTFLGPQDRLMFMSDLSFNETVEYLSLA